MCLCVCVCVCIRPPTNAMRTHTLDGEYGSRVLQGVCFGCRASGVANPLDRRNRAAVILSMSIARCDRPAIAMALGGLRGEPSERCSLVAVEGMTRHDLTVSSNYQDLTPSPITSQRGPLPVSQCAVRSWVLTDQPLKTLRASTLPPRY